MPFDRAAAIRAAARTHRDQGAVVGTSPDIVRHARELFGQDGEPDTTPPETRYVPAGRVLIEWIGDRSPFAHEQVAAACKLHKIPDDLVKAYIRFADVVSTRVDGLTSRTLTKERDGMTETVRWGPKRGTYIREVSAKDADRILSLCPYEFKLHGYAGEQPYQIDPIDRFVPPGLRSLVRAIQVRIGPPEKLAGVKGRMGIWTPLR